MASVTDGTGSEWGDLLPHVLWRAQQAVHSRVQSELEGLGVTVTQLGLAVHLDELGLMSASDLSRRFHITSQSVTTALTQLERKGWVRRLPHPVHKRVILHELTEEGLAGVTEGRQRMAALNDTLSELLGKRGGARLLEELRALTVALEGEDPEYAGLWPVVRATS